MNKRSALPYLGLLAGLGVATDILLRQEIFGLNYVLLDLLWLAIVGYTAHKKQRINVRLYVFGALNVIATTLIYVRAEPLVQGWLFAISAGTLLLLASTVYQRDFLKLSARERLQNLLSEAPRAIEHNFQAWRSSLKPLRELSGVRINRGVVLSAILVLVFIGLFSGADAVFQRQFAFVDDVWEWLGNRVGDQFAERVTSSIILAAISGIGLLFLMGRKETAKPAKDQPKQLLRGRDNLVILTSVTLVFALFVAIQARYLIGGASLPDGLSYADYARRGYGELLMATALAGTVAYGALRFSPRATRTAAATWLATLLVACNLLVTGSAWMRLALYEDAYGWTLARFVARLGLICIALGSILLVLWIHRRINHRQLSSLCWHTVMCTLLIAAALNPAAMTAHNNLAAAHQRKEPLDVRYLSSLSADAHPAICKNIPLLRAEQPDIYDMIKNYDGSYDENWVAIDNEQSPPPKRSVNHGLSRHYTLSQSYVDAYSDCLPRHQQQ
ncbi:hypothetical protein CR970_00280 [Candidatus Saccharibacteria bacterium]|nr:MAG: hypothetical protein CR970_00280 [Candidatus Saccharibacteria bacterium]